MDALKTLMTPRWKTRLALVAGAILVLSFAFVLRAEAKCSIRVADPLITARYQECKPREFLSYLYNDLVTPFSFTCAKKLSATCQAEKCAEPATEEERERCLGIYVGVLNECNRQIDDAARMARCKDTKEWPIEAVLSRAPAGNSERARNGPARSGTGPDHLDAPVTVEPLPAEALGTFGKSTWTSQSSRRR